MKNYRLFLLVISSVMSLFALLTMSGCKTNETEIPEYLIKYETDGNGTIRGKATQTVVEGKDCSQVTAVPDEGYEFVIWSDGLVTPERQDKNITEDKVITAQFKKKEPVEPEPVKEYTITYTVDVGGYIEGAAVQTIKDNESAKAVVAVPEAGYNFVKWSDGVTTAERQDKNIIADKTVTAEFEKIKFTVTYSTSEGGTIEGTAEQEIEYGNDAEFVVAIPDDGYKFVKWSDGLTTPTRQDTNIIADKSVTAEFAKIKFTVTYITGVGGTIDGTAEQEIEYGNDADFVVAVPDEGYRFVRWSDGNGSTIRKETTVTSEINVTAEFEFLYEGGDGTLSNPFTIANYLQLLDIWYYPKSNYKLINDLDLSGIKHEPIFDDNIYFKGNFDGSGYTVKNLTVETELNYPSLFGVIGGSVSNLNISNATIITTDYDTSDWQDKYYVGILVGMVKGYVHDINVSGEIKVDGLNYSGVAIGGITGYANGTVANCICNVRMNVKQAYYKYGENSFVFGGMIGVGESAFIRDCNAEGQINITECYWTESGSTGDVNNYSDILVGGMVGYYLTQTNTYIRVCQTNVEIYGDNHYKAGGFAGYLEVKQDTTLQVIDCSVYGDITCGRVGGFVYEAHTSSNSTLLFEKCIIENNITAFSYAAGFSYKCVNTSGSLQVLNSFTLGNIKTCRIFEHNAIVGGAAGFSWELRGVTIESCYAKRDMVTASGMGFSFNTSNNSYVKSCFYEGTIDLSYSLNEINGVGMFKYYTYSTLENCYSKVNFVTSEKNTSNLYAFMKINGNSKINNFYCYGNYCKVLDKYTSSNVVNGHVFGANIEESNLPQEGDESDITIYKNIQNMYFLADRLNAEQDEEVWVNIEGGLPKLKFEIR